MTTKTTVVGAKVSAAVAAKLDQLAADRRLTVSLLLRSLIERELASSRGETMGPVETATRVRLDDLGDIAAGDPRAQIAANLARRIDVDPSNGAQHSRELDRLLTDLVLSRQGDEPNTLEEIRMWAGLDLLGYGVRCPCGYVLAVPRSELADRDPIPVRITNGIDEATGEPPVWPAWWDEAPHENCEYRTTSPNWDSWSDR